MKDLTKLRILNLDGTEVTDAGLPHLKNLTRLEYLHLDGTEVSDIGLEHLKGLKSLTSLDVDNTYVTTQGAKTLRRALPNCVISHDGKGAIWGYFYEPWMKIQEWLRASGLRHLDPLMKGVP